MEGGTVVAGSLGSSLVQLAACGNVACFSRRLNDFSATRQKVPSKSLSYFFEPYFMSQKPVTPSFPALTLTQYFILLFSIFFCLLPTFIFV